MSNPQTMNDFSIQFVPPIVFRSNENQSEESGNPEDHRIYSEIYNSDAMLEEDAKIRAQIQNSGDSDDTEIAIAPILLWSDSTHLTSFGVASLWPIYMFFGSLSKYFRGKPRNFAAHHLAYIPKMCFIPW